jgi:hypothetical protein
MVLLSLKALHLGMLLVYQNEDSAALYLEDAELAANPITLFSGYKDFSSFTAMFPYPLTVNEAVLFLIIFFKWLQMLLEIEYHVLVHSHN